jgi:tRNA-intron lyase
VANRFGQSSATANAERKPTDGGKIIFSRKGDEKMPKKNAGRLSARPPFNEQQQQEQEPIHVIQTLGQGYYVMDPKHQQLLWEHGCFGKGVLSRSLPSKFNAVGWRPRISKKARGLQGQVVPQQQQQQQEQAMTKEEWMQISVQELLFLDRAGFQLNISHQQQSITIQQVWECFLQEHGIAASTDWWNHAIVLQYVAYHYFRSFGWTVRSGIKFGCDWLLYERGPTHDHAPYAIKVLNRMEDGTWTDCTRSLRLLTNVKKTLRYCIVEPRPGVDMQRIPIMTPHALLRAFRITSLDAGRWVPDATR